MNANEAAFGRRQPDGNFRVAEKKSGAIGFLVRLANVSKRSFGFRPVGHVQLHHSHVSTGRDSFVIRPRVEHWKQSV